MASDGETVMLGDFQGVRVGGGKLRVVGEVNGCGWVVQRMRCDGKVFYGHKVCGLFCFFHLGRKAVQRPGKAVGRTVKAQTGTGKVTKSRGILATQHT